MANSDWLIIEGEVIDMPKYAFDHWWRCVELKGNADKPDESDVATTEDYFGTNYEALFNFQDDIII